MVDVKFLLIFTIQLVLMHSFMIPRVNPILCRSKIHRLRPLSNRLLHTGTATQTTESKKQDFYITTPIYYVNGNPHLGHAYTSAMTDIIARYHKLDNTNVYFLTGTDEHGQKVEQSAAKANVTTIEFASYVSKKFNDMTKLIGCSNNDFIRTTEKRHVEGVQELWKRLEANGQIYLGAYEGWYSIRDEAFYTEAELKNGKAPTGADVEWVREESYFFRLSQWKDKLLEYYEQNPDFIAPKGNRNEMISFINQEGGLKDLSISRTTFSWGVPVPNNSSHVMYVWLDALANYMTAIGYPDVENEKFKRYWPASLHVVGKDILRFHAIFWPAFLMAAELPLPKRIFAHGWWTRDGEKMSKSVGNVLDPTELVDRYGPDYVRYYMASEFHFGNDGDFSHEAFCHRINVDLANDLGNLAQRVVTLVHRHCDGIVPTPGVFTTDDEEIFTILQQHLPQLRHQLKQQGIKHICDSIISLARMGNKYIDTQAPWVLIKTDPERVKTVLYVLVELLRVAGITLQPVTPQSCDTLLSLLGVPLKDRSFRALAERGPAGARIRSPTPVFPKLTYVPEPGAGGSSGGVETAPAAPADTVVGQLGLSVYDDWSVDLLNARLTDLSEIIRTKKAAKVSKEELKPLIQELLHLKERINKLKNENS